MSDSASKPGPSEAQTKKSKTREERVDFYKKLIAQLGDREAPFGDDYIDHDNG